MARTAAVLAGVAVVVAVAGGSAGWAAGPTTNDGIYTADQAAKGKAKYDEVCASCHQPSKFSGAEFSRAFGGKPLVEIDAAMAEMPMDNPGSLKRDEVASLIAFFLEMNKYPAGTTPLSGEVDALKAIMVAPRP